MSKKGPRSLKEALEGLLSPQEMLQLRTSFDIVGDIVVIEVPHELENREEEIGEAILRVHNNVKTVLKKGKHEGVFRTQEVRCIAGEDKRDTLYTESGVRMHVRIGDVYFSPRLSHERERIAELVKPGEEIAAFFAGCGPFPLVIAKQKKCKCFAVELNPVGVELMEENVRINKLKGEVVPILGDVRVVEVPKCDRVLMPLPKGAEEFLDAAFRVAKKGAIVHFYQFAPNDDLFGDAIARIGAAAERAKREVEIVSKKVVRSHAVRVQQVVIDFKIK